MDKELILKLLDMALEEKKDAIREYSANKNNKKI